jgi:hypothetical protein
VEELLKIFHRRSQDHLIARASRYLENKNSNDLVDDLGINIDNMPKNSWLKHQPVVIVLYHLEIGIEKSNQPSVHHTGATVKIPPMIGLDSVMYTIQRSHHNTDQTTFHSAMTGRSIILALRAALSPFVLWQTLRCGLPVDMILQKKPARFAKKIIPKYSCLWKKLGIIMAVKWTLLKVQT